MDDDPFFPGRDPAMLVGANGGFHPRDGAVVEPPAQLNYVRDNWMNPRHRFYNMQLVNSSYAAVLPETSQALSLPFVQPPADASRNENGDGIEELAVKKEGGKSKKRKSKGALTVPKAKKPKKAKENGNNSAQGVKPPKKTVALEINGIEMDISGLPVPVCSCTGVLSRVIGGAVEVGNQLAVLEKLAAEGYNFANPIDLKTHWARHGTNKFVTIR
ncbi:unnamed protein product [Vicia faba]|uniref:GAGA-binding transcriptional activator n=1 Tax=Vicia faba TaxID=3906 RepID=A0AAV1B4Q9_VICFA|nr:unnamed protein product [Vicia faba]